MSTQEHFYETDIIWNEGRVGTLSSPNLDDRIEVATPPEFPGGIEGVWSPEHLFVASVNSCLMTTFLAIAEYSKLDYREFNSKAIGKLEKSDGKYMISEIILSPVVTIRCEKDRHKAERILQKAEAACLISNSIRSKIILNPEIILGEFV